jgi:hypothetical protein
MKACSRLSLVVVFALAATADLAYGDQPPNVVESDNSGNTAMGHDALLNLDGGHNNTAAGYAALILNTIGDYNTAIGPDVLRSNVTASFNTGIGFGSLGFNTNGEMNTATGVHALSVNTEGNENTAAGVYALYSNTTGSNNSATGKSALFSNTTGGNNTAYGHLALESNTTGNGNAAQGKNALNRNTTGQRNVAVGNDAMVNNTTGRNNTAIGYRAGRNLTTGSDNIAISNVGVAGESHTMRLGTQGSAVVGSGVTRTFVAGIQGVTTGLAGSAVFVDANGQLGTISSSRRFKEDIQPMGNVSERLIALRPVTFHYKQANVDGSKPLQFGLLAEDVAEAFPELVIYGNDGKPETVSYHLLATLLLNEYQKDHQALLEERRLIEAQAVRIDSLERQSAELAQLRKVVAAMAEQIDTLSRARMVAAAR